MKENVLGKQGGAGVTGLEGAGVTGLEEPGSQTLKELRSQALRELFHSQGSESTLCFPLPRRLSQAGQQGLLEAAPTQG